MEVCRRCVNCIVASKRKGSDGSVEGTRRCKVLVSTERRGFLAKGRKEDGRRLSLVRGHANLVQPEGTEWSLREWPEALRGSDPDVAPLKVAVLLSGGVDSSVALELLHRAGHHCTAFYLKIWFQEDFRNTWDNCPWEEDLDYAQKTCDRLGIELNVVPLTKEYWQMVVEDSIEEIKRGRTPNPDMMCNSRIKFGAFYSYLFGQLDTGFDRVASGHYARLIRGANPDTVQLELCSDDEKDQTYFLAHLTQQQLRFAMFPLGYLSKSDVRGIAESANLPTKSRKDSQGICFLGKVKFKEFVAEHLGTFPGEIVEEETGTVLGQHEGYWFHTVGQRQGLGLSHGPWYVVRKDIPTNKVFVSKNYYSPEKRRDAFRCGQFNWIDSNLDPAVLGKLPMLMCKVRHGSRMYNCRFEFMPEYNNASVFIHEDDQGLAAGQYAVFYHNGICLGSGKILGALEHS